MRHLSAGGHGSGPLLSQEAPNQLRPCGRRGLCGRAGQAPAEPVPLDQVPPLALSEVMRDVDLFVGVASVGNDPAWADGGPEGRFRDYWRDYAFGDLGRRPRPAPTCWPGCCRA